MRLLHTMLRVGNLEASLAFYTQIMGMTLLRQRDNPEYRYSLAFVGYGDEAHHSVLELTYNWDTSDYDLGTGFGHLAIETANIYELVETLRSQGVKITREPGPVKGGRTEIAFIEDPDGYKIELIQQKDDDAL